MAAYDRSDRSTILPYQLEPTSTVADSESESTNSDYSSDSDSSAAMLTENVVDVRAGNTDWCFSVTLMTYQLAYHLTSVCLPMTACSTGR